MHHKSTAYDGPEKFKIIYIKVDEDVETLPNDRIMA